MAARSNRPAHSDRTTRRARPARMIQYGMYKTFELWEEFCYLKSFARRGHGPQIGQSIQIDTHKSPVEEEVKGVDWPSGNQEILGNRADPKSGSLSILICRHASDVTT